MADALKPIGQIDFSGGENVVSSPYVLGPKQVARCVNMILDEHGAARVRDGTLIQTSSPNPARPIVKLYDFVQVSGAIIKLAILLGTVSSNSLYNRGTTPWTLLGSFQKAYTIPDIVTFTNLAIIAGGNTESMNSFDGTTFVALTASGNTPFGCAHEAVHLGTLWAWNTSNVTTATDGPSSLKGSSVNNPNSWPAANQTFISKDDGQSGQGLALFTIAETGISPTATLIAFKDFSAYEITGVFGATNFAVQKIKSDMGCVAPRTIQFVSGFGIIRLTHKGFALFDGVNDTLISEEERPRLFGRDDIPALDWTNIALAYATQSANPPLYICVCPSNGAAMTLVFVYDLIRRAWTVANLNTAVSTFQLIIDPNVLPVVLGGDYSAGKVRRYFAGDTDDDGTTIPWLLRTGQKQPGSPMERAYYLRLLTKFFGVTQGTTITAKFFYGPTAPISQKTVTHTVPVVNTAAQFKGWGNDPYGTSPYGSTPVANVTDTDMAFGIGVIANTMAVELSGSGPGRLRGLELHARRKALTRSTVVNA